MMFFVYIRNMLFITGCVQASFISLIGPFICLLCISVCRRPISLVARASRDLHRPGVNKSERSWANPWDLSRAFVLVAVAVLLLCFECSGLFVVIFLQTHTADGMSQTACFINLYHVWWYTENRIRHQYVIVQLSLRIRAADV